MTLACSATTWAWAESTLVCRSLGSSPAPFHSGTSHADSFAFNGRNSSVSLEQRYKAAPGKVKKFWALAFSLRVAGLRVRTAADIVGRRCCVRVTTKQSFSDNPSLSVDLFIQEINSSVPIRIMEPSRIGRTTGQGRSVCPRKRVWSLRWRREYILIGDPPLVSDKILQHGNGAGIFRSPA